MFDGGTTRFVSLIDVKQIELILNKIMPKYFDWWVETSLKSIKIVEDTKTVLTKQILKVDTNWAYKTFREYYYHSNFPQSGNITLGDIVGSDDMRLIESKMSQAFSHVLGWEPKSYRNFFLLNFVNENINETRINKKSLLKDLQTMDYSVEDAKEELESMVKWFDNLPEELELYRIVWADDKEDVDLKSPGNHYSQSKKDLESSHSFAAGYGDNKFIMKVKANKSLIDVNQTLSNRILYPNEKEITLKNKGRGVKVLSLKKINKNINESEEDKREALINLYKSFGWHKLKDFTGLNTVELCNKLKLPIDGDFAYTLIQDLFKDGLLRKNVNEFNLDFDSFGGIMYWEDKENDYVAMVTPFWDGGTEIIPIDVTEPFEVYDVIILKDYGQKMEFNNIHELIDWFNDFYCPIVYRRLKILYRDRGKKFD